MKTKLATFLDTENKTETEPALKVGAWTGTVAGILSVIAYFAPNLIPENTLTGILVIGAFVLPIISALFTRGKVWSIASVEQLLEEAVKDALNTAAMRKKKENPTKPTPPTIL